MVCLVIHTGYKGDDSAKKKIRILCYVNSFCMIATFIYALKHYFFKRYTSRITAAACAIKLSIARNNKRNLMYNSTCKTGFKKSGNSFCKNVHHQRYILPNDANLH